MPAHSDADPSGMSRRTVLRGAAGAGAVGLAAAAGVGAVVAATRPDTKAGASAARPAAAALSAKPQNAGPLVVYLRDAKTGEFDVFAGTTKVRFRDPALVAQLLQAVQ